MPAWATPQLQTCDSLLCNLLQEDTVLTAREADEPVKHPLLDKVRECSANPDAAADFFLQILDPIVAHEHRGYKSFICGRDVC